jgi:hypothetical protein
VAVKKIALAFVALAWSANALAWNSFGHMMVAAAAYQQLTPTAKEQVDALIELNPSYTQWIAGVPKADRAEIAFIRAATWPDAIKSAPGYTNDTDLSAPEASQNIGYTDKLQHRYWHYIDVPFSDDGTPLVQPDDPNARTEIAAFRDALTSPTTAADIKSYDLAWLLHLVGDVHQPLHCTSRFSSGLPHGDRGGNEVHLCAAPCKDELHAFWDNVVGTSTKAGTARMAAGNLPSPQVDLAENLDESVWIDESFQAAKEAVYVTPIAAGAGPLTLTVEYRAADLRSQRSVWRSAGARWLPSLKRGLLT